jgi:hypothetical protein
MVVALLALFVACSGAAFAAGSFTASDGTITACRDNKSGVLRVINAQGGQSCSSSKETPITWKDGMTGKVADSDKLDGKDSTDFYAAGSKVADSDKLDGFDSTQLAGFGETAYKAFDLMPDCGGKELLTKTFSVPRETLVYASATTTFDQYQTDASAGMTVDILDASSVTILGSAGSVRESVEDGGGPHRVPLSLQGVIHSRNSTSTPLVLTPGNRYELRITAATDNITTCSAGFVAWENTSLSYLLIGKP